MESRGSIISAHDQWSISAGKGVVGGGYGWRYAWPMMYMISIEARVLNPGLCVTAAYQGA